MEDTTKKMYKLSNPLMFAIVMRDESLCKELLNRIFPERRVKELRFADNRDPKTIHQKRQPLQHTEALLCNFYLPF